MTKDLWLSARMVGKSEILRLARLHNLYGGNGFSNLSADVFKAKIAETKLLGLNEVSISISLAEDLRDILLDKFEAPEDPIQDAVTSVVNEIKIPRKKLEWELEQEKTPKKIK